MMPIPCLTLDKRLIIVASKEVTDDSFKCACLPEDLATCLAHENTKCYDRLSNDSRMSCLKVVISRGTVESDPKLCPTVAEMQACGCHVDHVATENPFAGRNIYKCPGNPEILIVAGPNGRLGINIPEIPGCRFDMDRCALDLACPVNPSLNQNCSACHGNEGPCFKPKPSGFPLRSPPATMSHVY